MPDTSSPIAHELNTGEVLAYGYVGSRLYGLTDENSDIDLAVISLGDTKTTHKLRDDMDYRIYSFGAFIGRLHATRMSETDLLMSGTMTLLNPNYEAYFKSFRVNSVSYMGQCEKQISTSFKVLTPEMVETHRGYKLLKAAVRCGMLGARMEKQRTKFNPVFSAEERDLYWTIVEDLMAELKSGATPEQLIGMLGTACE